MFRNNGLAPPELEQCGAYLDLAPQAHRTDNVVQGRPKIALIFARLVHLRIVLNLQYKSATGVQTLSAALYLCCAGAIAVDGRGVNSGGIGTRGRLQMVRGIRGPGGFH